MKKHTNSKVVGVCVSERSVDVNTTGSSGTCHQIAVYVVFTSVKHHLSPLPACNVITKWWQVRGVSHLVLGLLDVVDAKHDVGDVSLLWVSCS